MQFGTGEGGKRAVRWYFVRPGAKPLPYDHRFCSLNWTAPDLSTSGQGEVAGAPRPWDAGERPPIIAGERICGSAAQWRDGFASVSPPGLPGTRDGVPFCCVGNGPAVVIISAYADVTYYSRSIYGRGGVEVGGTAVIVDARTIHGAGGVEVGGTAIIDTGSGMFSYGGVEVGGSAMISAGNAGFSYGGVEVGGSATITS